MPQVTGPVTALRVNALKEAHHLPRPSGLTMGTGIRTTVAALMRNKGPVYKRPTSAHHDGSQ